MVPPQISTPGVQENCASIFSPPADKTILFEAGITHQYLNCFALASRCAGEQMELHLTIYALSSLTLADKEICLSTSKCVLSAKPIKWPFTQLLQQCTPTYNARTNTKCMHAHTPDNLLKYFVARCHFLSTGTLGKHLIISAYKGNPILYQTICCHPLSWAWVQHLQPLQPDLVGYHLRTLRHSALKCPSNSCNQALNGSEGQ